MSSLVTTYSWTVKSLIAYHVQAAVRVIHNVKLGLSHRNNDLGLCGMMVSVTRRVPSLKATHGKTPDCVTEKFEVGEIRDHVGVHPMSCKYDM